VLHFGEQYRFVSRIALSGLPQTTQRRFAKLLDAGGRGRRVASPPDCRVLRHSAFAKLKALPRKAAERTVDGLWDTIGRLIDLFEPQECANYFAAAGYDPD
jgi:hypothetical protein